MSAAQHIAWLNLVEKTGPFLAVGVLEEAFLQGLEKVETRKRQRVRSAYDEWRDAVDNADPQLDALHREWVRLVLEELLEYEPSVLKAADRVPATLTYHEPLNGTEVKPNFAVLSGDKARLLVARYAPDTDLSAPMAGETWAASPIERMTLLCRATGIRVGLVTDGEQWTLVSVPADGASSTGTWYARIWQQEPVTLQAFVSLLEVRRCFGPAEANLDSLFLRSLEHQNEITDTLGEQVRRAVEVLVQALDRADLDRDRQLLKDVSAAQLYEAGLTVMMRLVVLLCAEERKLLLLGEPIYDQYYAVSTLRSRLREDKERLGDEVLERRHDAWSRLLAVFRAVFGGIEHETLRLPALGGSLFDPDRFPFLEGRAAGTSWRDTPSAPLPIDNRTVLMLLTALQVLEQRTGALLLSYEALDVEQIGHVYEGLLERTVKRVPETTLGLIGSQKAVNPNVPLSELEIAQKAGLDKLLAYLLERTGRSESGLKHALAKPVDEPLYHRVLLACGSDVALADTIEPFANLLRTDNWGDPLAYRQDAFIVTLGAGRRETGTHYTPKSLTEPIVEHTLEPLVYIGPAEGKPKSEWRLKSPREILAIKVCDLAMGSGAFLVQACRWLAERLVEAWEAAEKAGQPVSIEGEVLAEAGGAELLPRDRAERVLIARRLIASRCLYGVDKNPMAVELAKVSLWLVTMMKGRPFSFLDHALKCGDSLLGVSSLKQIENFSLRPGERQVTFGTANLFRYVEEASATRRELEQLPSNDHTQIEAKNRLHAQAEAATAKIKALADCLIAFEMRGLQGDDYGAQRAHEAEKVQRLIQRDADAGIEVSSPKSELARAARDALHGHHPFHWPVEFPEVFENGGFSAVVGNPPFLGGVRVSEIYGVAYNDHLALTNPPAGKKSDLAIYFFRRAADIIAKHGCFGLLATKTVAQGKSRAGGLDAIIANGAAIYHAETAFKWPGGAAVLVCIIHITKLDWAGTRQVDGKEFAFIDGGLVGAAGEEAAPDELLASDGLAYQESSLLGMGFVLTPEEAENIFSADDKSREVITPYLGGENINRLPELFPIRYAINFGEMSEDEARAFSGAWKHVEQFVKPERMGKDAAAYPRLVNEWWKYWHSRQGLYHRIRRMERIIVCARVSKRLMVRFAPGSWTFNDKVIAIARNSFADFAVLQSNVHEDWAWKYGSTLKADLNYVAKTCHGTFPFPDVVGAVEEVGRRYYDHRQSTMLRLQEGLTSTYNHFHDPEEKSDDIKRLRALHVEMDQAVAAAYGWADLHLGHGFHETKQGVRYTVSEPARRTVLDRLLALNHQRHEEEVKDALHDKAAKKGKGKTTSRPTGFRQGDLL